MPASTGQFTIIDYYDAVSLTGFISANKALTQVFNPDNNSYNPSYPTENLVLTPSLFKAGSGTDLFLDGTEKSNIISIKWYDGATELVNDSNYGLPTFAVGANRPLTVKANIMTGSTTSKTYTCEIKFKDSGTGLELIYKNSITINRVTNSAGVTVPVVTAPSGNIFKNGGGTALTAKAELWRGAAIDSSSVTYTWYVANGAAWDLVNASTPRGTTAGWGTGVLTIPAGAVSSVAVFKCDIKDTDSGSPTYNQTFSGTIAFVDQTDPIQTIVESTAGDVFKGGVGSTTLIAKLYQNGSEIDAYGGTIAATAPAGPTVNQKWYDTSASAYKYWNGTTWVADTVVNKYVYKWYKRDKDGNGDPNFGGTGIAFKTGKFLAVGGADVTVKATFSCEID
jgi:hypothetical protein